MSISSFVLIKDLVSLKDYVGQGTLERFTRDIIDEVKHC